MKTKREGDSNCQEITMHQSRLTASMGSYSLSEFLSMANAAQSQSELLILSKLLTRPITQMDSCFHWENTAPASPPVKNTSGTPHLMRCQAPPTGSAMSRYQTTALMISNA